MGVVRRSVADIDVIKKKMNLTAKYRCVLTGFASEKDDRSVAFPLLNPSASSSWQIISFSISGIDGNDIKNPAQVEMARQNWAQSFNVVSVLVAKTLVEANSKAGPLGLRDVRPSKTSSKP